MRRIFSLFLLALVGACVGPSERPQPAVLRPAAPSAQPATPAPTNPDWQYRPATTGDWSYRPASTGSAALFGPAGGAPLLSVRCDPASHRISIVRAGVGSGPMLVRTSYGAASWPASASATDTSATRAANDGVLDQIAYSRGRFGIEVQGLTPLILPAWAEVARVIEDCRG